MRMGSRLLIQAMRFALASLEFSGAEAFVVDAIDSDAIQFYQRHDLTLLQNDGGRLYILTQRIMETLASLSLDL